MPKVAEVKIHFWDKTRFYPLEDSSDFKKGDIVIINTEHGLEKGEVLGVHKKSKGLDLEKEKIVRLARGEDISIIRKHESKKEKILEKAIKKAKEFKLPIKIVDVSFTICDKKIIFAFTADGRVDFRELVRKLSRDFQKAIRMQQIGSRDEAKREGGVGGCGRPICCASFLRNLESITTDMARTQQIVRQGNQRITGVCGRLMCCLAFEEEQYKELVKNMPEIGEEIKTKEGTGFVIDRNILKQTVIAEVSKGNEKTKFEIPISEL